LPQREDPREPPASDVVGRGDVRARRRLDPREPDRRAAAARPPPADEPGAERGEEDEHDADHEHPYGLTDNRREPEQDDPAADAEEKRRLRPQPADDLRENARVAVVRPGRGIVCGHPTSVATEPTPIVLGSSTRRKPRET